MKKIIIISTLVLTFFGCSSDSVFEGLSDDSSSEATIEEAAMALDEGNYEEVINSLAEIYTTTALNTEVARLLASGYMGIAGIDVTNFISLSSDVEADNYDTIEASLSLSLASIVEDIYGNIEITCNALDRSVLLVDEEAVFIDGHCIEDSIEYLDNAKQIISNLQDAGMETAEDIFKLGLTSAVHYVFIVGNATANALNSTLDSIIVPNRQPGLVPVPINKEAYRQYKSASSSDYEWSHDWSRVDESDFNEEDNGGDGLTRYQEDLINVNNAIKAIDQAKLKPNDMSNELDEFLREVLMMPTGDITNAMIIETATTSGIFEYVDSI